MNFGSAFLLIPSIVLVFSCGTSNETDPVVPLKDLRSMPEFTGDYKTVAREFYAIVFREDGYPAKYENGELFDHPLYGSYVINHYLYRYQHGEDSLAPYIRLVAQASLDRMSKKGDALFMLYPPGYTHSEVSGLTQSRYLLQFANLYKEFGDSLYLNSAKGVFNSFLVPINKGGFINEFPGGVSIEEYPARPISYVLNGWLTALWNLHLYRTMVSDTRADSLFNSSCRSVARLLPLYDFPEAHNSLYQLMGYQQMMLEFEEGQDISISKLALSIPGYESYEIVNTSKKNYTAQQTAFMFEDDITREQERIIPNDQLRLNILTSLICYPEPNELNIFLANKSKQKLVVYYGLHSQNPNEGLPEFNGWSSDTVIHLPQGNIDIKIPLKYPLIRNSLMPTSFNKYVNDRFHNVYHFVHIDKLNSLYEVTNIPEFKYWSDKWESYLPKWKEMPELQDPKISTEPL